MTTFLYSVLGFVIAIGLLTLIHEYGHFWVARRFGIKIKRFSIGFGKPLYSWHDKLGTEYAISSIPLGGYVKMLDENEAPVPANELKFAFNRKPVWQRMLVIVAGPVMNLMFAVLAYWLAFMWGISSVIPIISEVPKDTVAYVAGLQSGEEIISVNKQPTQTWEDIAVALSSHIGEHDFITITVKEPHSHNLATHVLNLQHWNFDAPSDKLLQNLGIIPYDPTIPIVDKILPDMPAAAAGLQRGDQIMSIDGQTVKSRSQFVHLLRNKYDHIVHLIIKRDNKNIPIDVTPIKKVSEGIASGYIGIQFANIPMPKNLIRVERFAPWTAFGMACDKTLEYTAFTFEFIGKMIIGKVSLQNLAGPLSIAKFAGRSVRSGFENFMGFLALVSISLGTLNLLPIPILDGGHLLFCIIELIRGRALSARALTISYITGFVLLGWVMILALYNDVTRLIQ